MKHSSGGPSSLKKRLYCPGSRAQEEMVEYVEEYDPAREQGIHCHKAMEHLVKGLPLDDLTEQEYQKVMAAVLSLNRCLAGDVIIPGAMRTERGGIVLCEVTYEPLPYSIEGTPGETGTLDLAIHYPGEFILMLDWKFGGGFVDAPRFNLQMHGYCLALWSNVELVPVHVAIVQPDARGYEETPWIFEVDEFQPMLDNLMDIVERSWRPDATCHVGLACVYCRAKLTCTTRLSAMGVMAQLGENWMEGYKALPLMERARFLTAIKALQSTAEEIIDFAKKTIQTTGQALPGWSSSPTTTGKLRLAPSTRQPSWPVDSPKKIQQEQVRAARITNVRI